MAPSLIIHNEYVDNDNSSPIIHQLDHFEIPAKFDDAARTPSLSQQLIGRALMQRIDGIDTDTCGPGDEDAFFVADLGHVYRQHLRWKKTLSRIQPHYGQSIVLSVQDLFSKC